MKKITFNDEQKEAQLTLNSPELETTGNAQLIRAINLSWMVLILLIGFNISFGQSTQYDEKNKAIAEVDHGVFVKKKNYRVNRATTISRWVSFDEAYADYYASTTTRLTRMTNGPLVNGANVHMSLTTGVDTAFTFGAYSLIDLRGTYYEAIFTNESTPFDRNDTIMLDSVAVGFVYTKYDNSVVDTAVVRVAVPSSTSTPAQMQSVFNYVSPNHIASGDTCRWLGVFYNSTAKEIANKVAEVKIPLTPAFVSNSANWRGTDSTSFFVDAFVGQNIIGHNGYLAVEVNVIHGRQLTSADTVGVDANWFSPLYISLHPNGTKPQYLATDRHCGGVLFSGAYLGTSTNTIFNSHWFGNSDNQTGSDQFQSAWVNLKITQNNGFNVGIESLDKEAVLLQNYPNPSSGYTTIKYSLENQANIVFEVMDVTGKKVISRNEGSKTSGTHSIKINTNELNAGVYFYSIVVNGQMITKKMTVTR